MGVRLRFTVDSLTSLRGPQHNVPARALRNDWLEQTLQSFAPLGTFRIFQELGILWVGPRSGPCALTNPGPEQGRKEHTPMPNRRLHLLPVVFASYLAGRLPSERTQDCFVLFFGGKHVTTYTLR